MTVGSWPGYAIDQSESSGFQTFQFAGKVWCSKSDVMEGLPTSLEEPTYGRVWTERFEKFDGSCKDNTNALFFEEFRLRTGFAGYEFEETMALLDGVHGDADMVQRLGRCGKNVHNGLCRLSGAGQTKREAHDKAAPDTLKGE
jgi:hypothetical protein